MTSSFVRRTAPLAPANRLAVGCPTRGGWRQLPPSGDVTLKNWKLVHTPPATWVSPMRLMQQDHSRVNATGHNGCRIESSIASNYTVYSGLSDGVCLAPMICGPFLELLGAVIMLTPFGVGSHFD